MTAEQHKAYTEACNAFGEALERIFSTEAPTMERQVYTKAGSMKVPAEALQDMPEDEDIYDAVRSLRDQKGKDWEILEFKQKINTEFDLLLFEPGNYMTRDKQLTYRLDHALDFVKDGLYSIHSVRRLSDNTIWTVGQNTLHGPVQKFEILGASIRARVDMGFMGLPALRQPKKAAIFTTADGVDYHDEYDSIFVFWSNTQKGSIELRRYDDIDEIEWGSMGPKLYSTRNAAEKAYSKWLEDQPVLSLNDIGFYDLGETNWGNLKEIVKDKIAKR